MAITYTCSTVDEKKWSEWKNIRRARRALVGLSEALFGLASSFFGAWAAWETFKKLLQIFDRIKLIHKVNSEELDVYTWWREKKELKMLASFEWQANI